MKTALLTGRTGFIGQNVLPILSRHFQMLAPPRAELDLRDFDSVRNYFLTHRVDVVFHCANPNPVKNPQADTAERMTDDSIRLFLNLYACRGLYGKMVYLGSGAEYDKRKDIVNIREAECFRSPPQDSYGLAKYTVNLLADQSENIYNLCLFACYGPGDHPSKFITHCIACCRRQEDITIRQECRFDFVHVYDLAAMMVWVGEHTPKYHMYNVSGGQHVFLSEIAAEVKRQMGAASEIKILTPGLNREYTADGSRFRSESGISPTVTLEEGIALQIKSEREPCR